MSNLTLEQNGNGFAVATVGNIADFEGKAFVKEILGTTSMEVSFGSIAAGESSPFFHKHKQNEELYIVTSGEGKFVLDGKEVNVKSGSVIRVSPSVSRSITNTGSVPLVHICIQAKENSQEGYTMNDGVVL